MSLCPWINVLLLAELDSPVRSFLSSWLFGITGLVILTVWGGLFLWDWYQNRPKPKPKQIDLFVRLCQEHHLNSESVESIKSVAEQRQVKDPAILFVDPMYLRQAGLTDPQFSSLATRLFGDVGLVEKSPA